ncbi:MAG: ABC transporter ATP-binding protein [Burkholderiales bacterium]
MSAPQFAFEDVCGGYGGSIVVRGVSGAVAAGEVLCVLGRNGVGKSTLLRLLHGFLPLARGRVRYAGRDLAGLDPARRAALGISFAPQERIVFEDLTVRENLSLMRAGRPPEALARFPRLAERLGQRAGTLSGGERKLLSLVRVLAEARPVALLDEPSEGVQAENVRAMAALIGERKAAGAAFVIVEQNLALVEAVADRYLILDQGRVVRDGAREGLRRAELAAHLGI